MTTKEHFLNLYKKRSFKRYLLTTLGYTFYFWATIGFIGLLPVILLLMTFSEKVRIFIFSSTLGKFVFFLTRIYLPFVKVYNVAEDSYPEQKDNSPPVIYVANHRSQLDGPIVLARLKKTGVLMKISYVRSNPAFASFVNYSNFISVDPSSLDSLNTAMKRCKALLSQGQNILVFPEGSRSRSARLQPFKDLAFRLSIETNTPVVPIIVHTTYPIMAKIKNSLYPPEVMRLTIRSLPQIHSQPGERPSDFANRVWKCMADEIKDLDKNTYWEYL